MCESVIELKAKEYESSELKGSLMSKYRKRIKVKNGCIYELITSILKVINVLVKGN